MNKFPILLILIYFSIINAAIYNNSYALIIGIDKYENIQPLNYAVKDAESIQDILIETFKFPASNVTLLTDKKATKQNILTSFFEITEDAQENDRVLIFFAGHGETMVLDEGGEKGYLLPVDGNKEQLYLTAIPMDELKNIALMAKAKHLLYLVDACYGGILTVGSRGLENNTSPQYIDKITKNKGRQIITAGGRGEEVIEKPEWGHSAFTLNLKRGLKQGSADMNFDGYITANELGVFLQQNVTIDSENQQTPQYGRMTNQDGQFIFQRPESNNRPTKQINPSDEKLDLLISEIQALKGQINIETTNTELNNNNSKNIIDKNLISHQSLEDETLYSISNSKSVTKPEFISLLESDTIDISIKTRYVFNYGNDLLKQKYNLSFSGNAGFNRVDGFFLLPKIKWEPLSPKKTIISVQSGYSFSAQRPQYEISWKFKIIQTNNFLLNTYAKLYDKTDTYDRWRQIEFWESYLSFAFGQNGDYNYFQNNGFTIGLTVKNHKKGLNSFHGIQYFQETQTPLFNTVKTDIFGAPATFKENLFNPNNANKTDLKVIRILIPGLNNFYSNKRKNTSQYTKTTFTYTDSLNHDFLSIFLIGKSQNWPKTQYELKKINNKYEVDINLEEGMYYYQLLIDSMKIVDPNNDNLKYITEQDSVSVITIGTKGIVKKPSDLSSIGNFFFDFGSVTTDTSFNFFRQEFNIMFMLPINPSNLIRSRLITFSGSDTQPFSRRFYAGGSGTLRGYNYEELNDIHGSIINIEYQKKIYPSFIKNKNLGLLVFVDYAESWSKNPEYNSFKDLFKDPQNYQKRTTAGIGLDIDGMKFILAKPIDKSSKNIHFMVQIGSFLNRNLNLPN